jgi:cytochrome c-type biogenesis protein CcmH/NrfF
VWIGPIVAAAIGVLAVALVLLRRRPRPASETVDHLDDLEAQVDRLRRARGDDHT